MLTVERSIIINKPVKDVFDFITAEGNSLKIQPDVTEIVDHGPRNTVGSSYTEVRKFIGQEMRTTMELTVFEPEKKWVAKVIKGPVPYEMTITYEPVEGGTKYTCSISGETKGFFKLAENLVAVQLGKTLEHSNQLLKELVEKA